MLLIYQAGSVRVGEVVRYTLTYTPSSDPILPTPEKLFVKVKNTSATPLRAAYLHGPYTLYAACYPFDFDPNGKYEPNGDDDIPQHEPYIKAGGSWDATIHVPQRLRQTPQSPSSKAQNRNLDRERVKWVIEIVSQVVFSTTAVVHFELLVGRDEKSVNLGSFPGLGNSGLPPPAPLHEHFSPAKKGTTVIAVKGVFSKSITLAVDDTASLWNTPPFPSDVKQKDGIGFSTVTSAREIHEPASSSAQGNTKKKKKKKKRRVHLVILTHGLHSNLGADMLFLKESIDKAARTANQQAKERKSRSRLFNRHKTDSWTTNTDHFQRNCEDEDIEGDPEDTDDDEQVIVRGFPGNATRTERGIQYLGKRLARYVLLMTYPDQPYLPPTASKGLSLSRTLGRKDNAGESAASSHTPSGPANEDHSPDKEQPFQITSISFIGHSLGGLVQTYAIAYIQKYSPQFFERIQPVNFIALATPFLGLSHENPIYVRFALDFGLVGRTGQDLGLSWTAPRMKTGWSAIMGNSGGGWQNSQDNEHPGAKPLLRILPTGYAHLALVRFQHRTIYSNVVNDGIVPLRTSCLLFLDWKGLDRVEKARRENGLVGTVAEWGWAELTGANSKSPRSPRPPAELVLSEANQALEDFNGLSPSPPEPLPRGDDVGDVLPSEPSAGQFLRRHQQPEADTPTAPSRFEDKPPTFHLRPLNQIFAVFRSKETKHSPTNNKHAKIYKRSQTLSTSGNSDIDVQQNFTGSPSVERMNSVEEDDGLYTPPTTTVFESAGDLLMPPLPPVEFTIDPSSRLRTIFHDRIYHPEDIPPPLAKRRVASFASVQRRRSVSDPTSGETASISSGYSSIDIESGLKVEEKIARAYHKDLSWRKVLVRLEPDAHNNIIVRRMFTNAYGWPVIKHLVDTHFGYTHAAYAEDQRETSVERAIRPDVGPSRTGEEVEGQTEPPAPGLEAEDVRRPGAMPREHAEGVAGDMLGSRGLRTTGLFPHGPGQGRASDAGVGSSNSMHWSGRFLDDDGRDYDTDQDFSRRYPRPG